MQVVRAFCVTLFCAASLWGQTPTSEQIRAAATKAVALLQKSCDQTAKIQTCFSCHHSGLPIMALSQAREHGIPVDEEAARRSALQAFSSPGSENLVSLDLAVQGPLIIDPGMQTSLLLLMSGKAGLEPSPITAVLARRVANWQSEDGSWPSLDSRPPASHSLFTAAAQAARATDLYLPAQLESKKRAVVERARRWLEKAQPKTTEDFTFRLFGLKWTGAEDANIRDAAEQLLALQQKDGGWSQIRSRATGPYATAEALVALHEAGGMPVTAPEWRRGLRFLLEQQQNDGSWLVQTRQVSPFPISPPYFESGYPHGKHQFVSIAAASWAIRALALALPQAREPDQPLPLPELSSVSIEPWMETVLFGTVGELKALLDQGLDPNSATPEGTTLLMGAGPDADKVALLINRGADVKAKAATGFTALHAAATHRGSADSVRALLEAGAAADSWRDVKFSASPLSLAAYVGDRDSVSLLREAGGAIDRPFLLIGQFLVTPANSAIAHGYIGLLQDLANAGAVEPNELDEFGVLPLSRAVIENRFELVRALVDLGADVNSADEFGYTPALYAATVDHGDTQILEFLIDKGADVTVKSKEGYTAASNARKFGYPDILRILEAAE